MSIALVVNGITYDYPEQDDTDWGPDATDWAAAITSGVLQKAGGLFLLLAEVDFGSGFGIKSLYYKSRTANPADAGQVRLARADVINWRNQANGANLSLGVSASDNLQFNGVDIQPIISVADTATIDLTLSTNTLSADIVAGSITNSMVSTAAGIAYSKLASLSSANILVGSAGNVATSVAVAGDITLSNAGVTAIGANKVTNAMLAQMAASTIKGNSTGGAANAADLTATQVTAMLNAFVGDSGAGGTKGLVPAPTTGDATKFLAGDGTWGVPAGAGDVAGPGSATDNGFVRFNGTTGKIIKNSPATITNADVIAAAGIVYSKLDLTGGIVNADLNASAAIAYSKLAALTSANILVGSAGNVATVTPITGDISLTNSGVTAYAGTVPLNKGGTGQTTKAPAFDALSPMTTGGDLIYGGASGTGTRLANGSAGQYLKSAGGTGAPAWQTFTPPTIQKFTATGTTTGYLFTCTSFNATVGATYTNNGNTYTVLGTVAAGTQLFTSQAAAPQASGTLTKAAGTGDATITFSASRALATYTLPANATYLRVRLVGGGGGGGGSGSTSGTATSAGTSSVFGAGLLLAGGGGAGSNSLAGGAGGSGGTASLGTGPIGVAIPGTVGGAGGTIATSTVYSIGSYGGNAPYFVGGGMNGPANAAGGVAITNTGGGGGGAGTSTIAANHPGTGGGSGGFVEAIITSPAATYAYAVGTAGTAGGAGTSGYAGGGGAAGQIIIEEYYQ